MRIHAAFLALVVLAAGCGEDLPDLPTAPSIDTTVPVTELFEGTFSPGATPFYSFRVLADRDVNVMLASLVGADGLPIDVPLTLGLGVPQGTGCAVTRSTTAAPGLRSQLGQGSPSGTYCVSLGGTSVLAGPATFAIRIRQEPSELPDAGPAIVMFASQLVPGGASSRTFPATRPGAVAVTLESLSQSARVRLAVGMPPLSGSGCHVSRVVEVTAGGGPHLSVPIDVGTFCVSIIDPGALTAPAAFQIRIEHP